MSGCTGLGLLWWPGGYNNTGACAVVGLAVCGLGSPGNCPRIKGLLHCGLRFLGGSAVLGGWASSGLLLRPGGPGALGRAWLGLGVALVVGPPGPAGLPAVTLLLPTVTSQTRHLLRHQSGPRTAGPVPAQLL